MVMVAFVVSLFAGIICAFAREYWITHRAEIKNLLKQRVQDGINEEGDNRG
jgi:hypothetical protein